MMQPLEHFQHQTKIKASKFIADVFPIRLAEEAASSLAEIKKREHTANHHCFAWRIGLGDQEVWRVSDDGEPSGTAGMPIYQALVGGNITNILAVVTRYFGGTKLGKGGLIRAYSGVVQETILLIKTRAFIPRVVLVCECDFEHANLVYRLIETYEAKLLDQKYAARVSISFSINEERADALAWDLHELSNGTIKAKHQSLGN